MALVLDEPFSGLDPNAVETTLQVLRETADTGVPVLFSSHQLDVDCFLNSSENEGLMEDVIKSQM